MSTERGYLSSVRAPSSGYLAMAPEGHEGLRTSICGQPNRNNLRAQYEIRLLECNSVCNPKLVPLVERWESWTNDVLPELQVGSYANT